MGGVEVETTAVHGTRFSVMETTAVHGTRSSVMVPGTANAVGTCSGEICLKTSQGNCFGPQARNESVLFFNLYSMAIDLA